MNLSLLIKDYNTSIPLANKQITLTNIDSKQTYTQTTDSRGYVSFSIDSKQRGDFFRVELVNDSTYMPQAFNLARKSHTSSINNTNTPNNSNTTSNTHTPISYATQKLLTPNNYQNHPAILYFKPKISLYFNGTTLSILQGEQTLSSFQARSGKALTIKEKEQLQQERGYKYFVTHTNKGLFSNETMYFCLDKDWQKQKDKGAIPEGEYYIKPNEINKRTTYIQENTFGINTRIYTDKECTNVVESNTNRDNFYLHGGDTYGNAGGIDVVSNDNDFFGILQDKLDPAQEVVKLQVVYPKKLESSIDFIYINNKDGIQRDKEYLHTDTIFAPGTYIELELTQNANNMQGGNTTLSIQWAFTLLYNQKDVDSLLAQEALHSYTFYPLLDSKQVAQQKYNVRALSVESTKIGFSLPLTREYEDCTQCFIIVFAFEHTKTQPDSTDPHIIINMSFKVGKDSNGSVIESKREEQILEQRNIYYQTSISNLKAWNTLQCICNVKEAVDFLRANKNKLDEFYQNNQARYTQKDSNGKPLYNAWFDYYRIYPSLAGKIAYIYYRFDVGDDGFVGSVVSDKGEYKKDREKYINGVKEVFENKTYRSNILNRNITFKEAYEKDIFSLMQNGNLIKYPLFHQDLNGQTSKNGISFFQERKEFIITLVKKICKHFDLNLYGAYIDKIDSRGITSHNNKIFIAEWLLMDSNKTQFHGCNGDQSCINISMFEYLSKRLIGTIAHECRHLYIREKFYQAKFYDRFLFSSTLKEYLATSFDFYISNDEAIQSLFQPYKKLCNKADEMAVYCSTIQGYNSQNAYQIQPNERDSRYVAAQIIGKNTLNLK